MSYAAIELEIIRHAEAHGTLHDTHDKLILTLAAELVAADEGREELIGEIARLLVLECARMDVDFVGCLKAAHNRKPKLEVV